MGLFSLLKNTLLDEYLYYDKDLYDHVVIDKNFDIPDIDYHIDDRFYNHVFHSNVYWHEEEYL